MAVVATDSDGRSGGPETTADLRVVVVGLRRAEKEIASEDGVDVAADDEPVDEEDEEEEEGSMAAAESGLFADWNVIVIGMACGAGLLAVVIVIVIVLTVCRKHRRVKQANYNCRSVGETRVRF